MTLHDTTFSRIASVAVREIDAEFPLEPFEHRVSDSMRCPVGVHWPNSMEIGRDVVGFFWTRWNVDYEAG